MSVLCFHSFLLLFSPGFYGASCDSQCSGGSANPCNGHGECDRSSGECTCHANYAGSGACDTCTSGFLGADCSLAQLQTSSDDATCTAISNGYFTLFDGTGAFEPIT